MKANLEELSMNRWSFWCTSVSHHLPQLDSEILTQGAMLRGSSYLLVFSLELPFFPISWDSLLKSFRTLRNLLLTTEMTMSSIDSLEWSYTTIKESKWISEWREQLKNTLSTSGTKVEIMFSRVMSTANSRINFRTRRRTRCWLNFCSSSLLNTTSQPCSTFQWVEMMPLSTLATHGSARPSESSCTTPCAA